MKAWILEKQSNIDEKPLKLADVPLPVPDKQEVRIKVLACGICRTDIHIAEGDLALKKSPLILGHEIVEIRSAFPGFTAPAGDANSACKERIITALILNAQAGM